MLMVALTSNPIPLVLFATKCYQQISVSESWKWKQTMTKTEKKSKTHSNKSDDEKFSQFSQWIGLAAKTLV